MLHGQCHCGKIHYEIPQDVIRHSLCHCSDCRRQSGAPVVAWVMVSADKINIKGMPQTYHSSENGRRMFCGDCGTNLFYRNDFDLPGIIDVLTATLDEPARIPPTAQYQTAERIPWMETIGDLPSFERWPEE